MITPNQFEAELLTGKKIRCEQDAIDAVVSLLRLGPKVFFTKKCRRCFNNPCQIVVLTSAEFDPSPEAPQGTFNLLMTLSSNLKCCCVSLDRETLLLLCQEDCRPREAAVR